MNEKLTDITILLDRSGSMFDIWGDAIGGLESFLEKQKEAEGDATISLILFDGQDNQEVVIDAKDVNDTTIDLSGYNPRSSTPLNDATVLAINATGERLAKMEEKDRPGKVLFIIYTDGHENASFENSAADVKSIVEKQQNEFSWDFVFMGADIDAFAEGSQRGYTTGNTMSLSKGKTGQAFDQLGTKVSVYRSAVTKENAADSLAYTDLDRDELK